jgi:cytochrome c556
VANGEGEEKPVTSKAKQTLVAAVTVVVAGVTLGVLSAPTVSGSSGTDAIKARQQAMENVGDAMKALAAIAKGEAPFDAAVVAKNAGTIADRLEKVATLFPDGSQEGDVETWAKPEIWSDHVNFDKTREAARAAALALQAVTDEAAYRPALGQLGGNCKSCHDTYRRPKK